MIDDITIWHKRARQEPTEKDFHVQLGCHIEEFIEMLDAIVTNDSEEVLEAFDTLEQFANGLKSGLVKVVAVNRKELLDSLADQVVTAVGVGVCAGMDMPKAVAEVNASNWSKFN